MRQPSAQQLVQRPSQVPAVHPHGDESMYVVSRWPVLDVVESEQQADQSARHGSNEGSKAIMSLL